MSDDFDDEPLTPAERASALRLLRDEVDMKEFSRGGAKYVRLTHRERRKHFLSRAARARAARYGPVIPSK